MIIIVVWSSALLEVALLEGAAGLLSEESQGLWEEAFPNPLQKLPGGNTMHP